MYTVPEYATDNSALQLSGNEPQSPFKILAHLTAAESHIFYPASDIGHPVDHGIHEYAADSPGPS